MTQTDACDDIKRPDPVAWFVKRLSVHGCPCKPTKEAIRRTLIDQHMSYAICGTGSDGKGSTYRSAFERAFGESLNREGEA